jgi:hypothetical protein
MATSTTRETKMNIIEQMKAKAKQAPKGIRVKVESIDTGEVVKNFYCGTDQRRADKLEDGLLQKTNLDKYHVYQSVTV